MNTASCSWTCNCIILVQMEATAAPPSLTFSITSSRCYPSLLYFSSHVPQSSVSTLPPTSLCTKNYHRNQLLHLSVLPRKEKRWTALRSSSTDIPPTTSDPKESWVLDPVGDGDCRHIGFKVPLPKAFEIASNVVTVGRLPEKADIVIPVITVSGVHARLERKGEALIVTDLGSTNGTYINDRKLNPGDAAPVLPGSLLTFGDTNLAIFRVSKIEKVEPTSKIDELDDRVKSTATA